MDFASAERRAAKHGLPTFSQWRSGLERRYTTMPPWYWNDSMCRQNYVAHVDATVEWQEREAKVNTAAMNHFKGILP